MSMDMATIFRTAHAMTRSDCKFFPDLTYRKHFRHVLQRMSEIRRYGLEPKRT
jgi:hypothetical protein